MRPQDKRRFLNALVALGEYHGKTLSDGVLALYWQGLRAYDIEAVEDALKRHVALPEGGQFMPKIADIVKLIEGGAQDRALAAWSKVDAAVRQVGPYQSVVFDDPIIHRVITDMGGWIALCSTKGSEWPFKAKEFETRYRGLVPQHDRLEYTAKLAGISESENRVAGFVAADPILVGNREAALRVLKSGAELDALPGPQFHVKRLSGAGA